MTTSSTGLVLSTFLTTLIGQQICLRLGTGDVYRGTLLSIDSFMNLVLEGCHEYSDGDFSVPLGDVLFRGSNGRSFLDSLTHASAPSVASGVYPIPFQPPHPSYFSATFRPFSHVFASILYLHSIYAIFPIFSVIVCHDHAATWLYLGRAYSLVFGPGA